MLSQMFRLFGNDRNIVKSPKILICSVGDAAESADFQKDETIYQVYRDITKYRAATGADLLAFVIGKQYDIVHILAAVSDDGMVSGMPGIQILAQLSNVGVKLIIFASENLVENYVAAFPAKQRIGFIEPNLILTLERKDANFVNFFTSLFKLMAKGNLCRWRGSSWLHKAVIAAECRSCRILYMRLILVRASLSHKTRLNDTMKTTHMKFAKTNSFQAVFLRGASCL